MSDLPARYLHLIPGLRRGGAETHLATLLAGWTAPAVHHVVSLLPDVPIADRFTSAGIAVSVLDMGSGPALAGGALKLRRLVRGVDPDAIIGWMYAGNLAASLAARLAPRRMPLLWNIRATADTPQGGRSDTALWVGARLSRGPDAIVYNAAAARRRHAALGYADARATVIPNGIDVTRFQPSAEAYTALRARLGLAPEALIVGRVGRYHWMKDYGLAVRVAALVRRGAPDVHFVFAGSGVDHTNGELMAMIAAAGMADRVHLLGDIPDVERAMAGFDVALSTSATEAFPNVVAEAMASGAPNVVTDVGDAALIVGDTGHAAPHGDAGALAAALAGLLADGERRRRLSAAARARVVENFALDEARRRFAALWASCRTGTAGGRA